MIEVSTEFLMSSDASGYMSGWCNVSKCLRYHHDQHRSRVHALDHNHLGPGAHSLVNTKLIHCPVSVT